MVCSLVLSGQLSAQNGTFTKPRTIQDSLTTLANVRWLTDSLTVTAWADSLKTRVETTSNLELEKLYQASDSLTRLQLPTGRISAKVDSLQKSKANLLAEADAKKQTLLGTTKTNIDAWKQKWETTLGSTALKLPSTNMPSFDLPPVPKLEIPELQNLNLSTNLQKLNTTLPFGDFKALQDKIGSLPDLKSLSKNPEMVLEQAALKIEGVEQLQTKMDVRNIEGTDVSKVLETAKSPEAAKAMAVDQVKKEAINHFAGKEEVLQKAMAQVAKYKQKYPSINSLSDIKKRPPNPLKGKPLRERLVPGFGLQIHRWQYFNIDVNPFMGYKLTPRFTTGLGWNQRTAIDKPTQKVISQGRVFGPRGYIDFKIPRGFSLRLEGEWMNMYVPPFQNQTPEGKRQWQFTTMLGLKRDYRLTKSIKGYTILQGDIGKLFNQQQVSPYGNIANLRFGFEFSMKARPAEKKG